MSDCLKKILSHDSGDVWQFVKYGTIGVMATLVQFAVFYALAATVLPCLTPEDVAVRYLGLPAVTFSGTETWYAARWFAAAAATVVGFTLANVFCWLMNRRFVFRPGKFVWWVEFAMFYGAAAAATAIALLVQSVLISCLGVTTSVAAFVEVIVSFLVNYGVRKFFIFKEDEP